MTHLPLPLAATALALAVAAAHAEPAEEIQLAVSTATAPFEAAVEQLEIDAATWDFAGHELAGERVVRGAPYCADAMHETVQTLADGNRIVRKQQTRLCRDGEGRTRQEVERGGRKLVWLRDPVAKAAWLLDPARKTVRRAGAAGEDAAMAAVLQREHLDRLGEQARAAAETARTQARQAGRTAAPPAPPVPPMPPAAPVVITRPAGPGEVGRQIEFQVLRLDGDGAPPQPPMIHWQAQRFAPRGAGVLSALGSKEIDGVRVNGERESWTIEAGKVGNEKPIVITREVWTSPDLLLTVQSRDADPRSGETLYRLANLKRGEPDAALMKVPADYAQPAPRRPAASVAKG